MGLKETGKYLQGDFAVGAKEFLLRTGVWNPSLPLEVIIENFNAQMRQVAEESLEYLGAYSVDNEVEKLDGLVDFHFTLVNFEFMGEQLQSLIGDDKSKIETFEKVASGSLIDLLDGLVPLCLQLKNPSLGTERFILGAKRIIANNRTKYTDSYEEAKSWGIDLSDGLETQLVKTTVEGKDWYCLKDNMGKVRKRVGFVGVRLEDLVGDTNE